MKRKRLTEAISLKLKPKTMEKFSLIADAKDLTLSELARMYIENGIAGEEMP